jgi:hypothetical protein
MQAMFGLFLKEKKYLKGVAPKTLTYYQLCWDAFKRYKGEVSELGLKTFVIKMREADVSPGAVNAFARGINSFLSWLHENSKTETHLKIKQLKTEKRILKTCTEKQAKELVHYKPKKFWEKRIHTMILFLIDTGVGLMRRSLYSETRWI